MKTTTRSNIDIYLPMAALILAALAIPAAAQQQVPFKSTFQGKDAVNPPTITTSAGGPVPIWKNSHSSTYLR